jgi:hypothetical protein
MSGPSSTSQARSRRPQSPLQNSDDDGNLRTPSPEQDDSLDEYSPPRQSAQSKTAWISPTHRSDGSGIPPEVRKNLAELYRELGSTRCLITQMTTGVQVAHIVPSAAKSRDVSHFYSLPPSYGSDYPYR